MELLKAGIVELTILHSSIRKDVGLDLFFPRELIDSMKVESQKSGMTHFLLRN